LFSLERPYGYLLLSYNPADDRTYQGLRLYTANAIERLDLSQRIRQYTEQLEAEVAARTAELAETHEELQRESQARLRLQQETIEAQKAALLELSTPVIPIMDHILVLPLIGPVDTVRAQDITRTLLKSIGEYRAKIVIVDITGVSAIDTGVAQHLNRTIQAARLKGTYTIITGISDEIAETIVDLGIDWSSIETLGYLRTGLEAALRKLGKRITS
jgi:rsbT co-antagonist protein RsbR